MIYTPITKAQLKSSTFIGDVSETYIVTDIYSQPIYSWSGPGQWTLISASTRPTTSVSAPTTPAIPVSLSGGGLEGSTISFDTSLLSTEATQAMIKNIVADLDAKQVTPIAGRMPVDGSGVVQPVSISSVPLPTGAATAANQVSANTSLATIASAQPTLVSGRVPVDGSGVTQPVSLSTLPLPSGAATAANQTAANASLSTLASNSIAPVGGRLPVDGSGVTQPVSVTSLPLPTGAATSADILALNTNVASLVTNSVAPVAGRLPVDGSSVVQPVSGPLTNDQLRATPVNVESTSLTSIDSKFPSAIKGGIPTTGIMSTGSQSNYNFTQLVSQFNNFSEVAPTDLVLLRRYANGQTAVCLSLSPLVPGTESKIKYEKKVECPGTLDMEFSVVRSRHQFFSMLAISEDPDDFTPVPSPINIVNIYQSSADLGVAYNAVTGTVVTVTLESPLPSSVTITDWVNINGLNLTSLNYQNLVVKWISADRLTFTANTAEEATITTQMVAPITPTLGTAYVSFFKNLASSQQGAGYRFSSVTATSVAYLSASGPGDVQVSGTTGSQLLSIGSSAPVYSAGTFGNVDLRATTRYRFDFSTKDVSFLDVANETIAITSQRVIRPSVKPHPTRKLTPCIRGYNPPSMTRPVAKIISISKAGSTTWTVTHDGSYTFQTGNYVTIKGCRDQTNFANISTPVSITVLNSTQFTLVSTTGTATGYGGAVVLCSGLLDTPNVMTGAGSSALMLSSGWLQVTCNTTVAGVNVGDIVELFGFREDLTGADISVDGTWEVANLSTTVLLLAPVYDISGNRVSPDPGALSKNCSGAVFLRATARLYDTLVRNWADQVTRIEGQGTGRADMAMPMYSLGGTFPVTQSTRAAQGAGWQVKIDNVNVADIASAAITTTATTTAITPEPMGAAAKFCIYVSAATGTNKTLDVGIEVSYDLGTNYRRIYDFPRITATGTYESPTIPLDGMTRIRYVRTVGGTSPSFTMTLNRIVEMGTTLPRFRQWIDRSVINLNTLGSTTTANKLDGGRNLQMVLKMGAITTTAPELQFQVSDDDGLTYQDVPGTLTAVANSTVQLVVKDVVSDWFRVKVVTAGSGATLDHILTRAF